MPVRLIALIVLLTTTVSCADESNSLASLSPHHNPPDLSVVSDRNWKRIDQTVERGLRFLASQQQADGSIQTKDSSRPAIAALTVMACLSAGHMPGEGPYGEVMDRAIDFVLSVQREDGLFTYLATTAPVGPSNATHVAIYNHGMCGLMLSEVYGMTTEDRAARIRPAIRKAIVFVRNLQKREVPPGRELDRGGWRYIKPTSQRDFSDTSVTSWMIMFLRSAHNAGFEVPVEYVNEGIDYMLRCCNPDTGGFRYGNYRETAETRGTTGAGIVTLFLSGRYNDEIERKSGAWFLHRNYSDYNRSRIVYDRYFYGVYYSSQAAYQLGGHYWSSVYPTLAMTLVENQNDDGGWDLCHHNGVYGRTYPSCMAILALTPPHHLLPIYQR